MYGKSEMFSVRKKTSPIKQRLLALTVLGAFSLIMTDTSTAFAQQGKTFAPSGHTYAPNDQRIPHPNSRRSRLQADADVYETEIYRRQLEQSKFQERFQRFNDHSFFSPDQLQ